MLEYLKKNCKYHWQRLAEWVECRRIAAAPHRFAATDVPAWCDAHAAAIAAEQSVFSALLEGNASAVVDAARILGGELRMFCHTIECPGGIPDWHKDYFSGVNFRLAPYPEYVVRDDARFDIAAPWEVSRMQFVPTLIQAFRLTSDQCYAKHFFRVLADWERANPYLMGVNWCCGLDVAIRALNIALGAVYFGATDEVGAETARRLLWRHLEYLQERDLYLPKTTVNNHQLVAAALHYGLLHLYRGDRVARWRHEARELVQREIMHQFREDGGNFESAIQYHQFSLESAFVAAALAVPDIGAGDGRPVLGFDNAIGERLLLATTFTADCVHCWGAVPQVGDSSDGRVLLLTDYFAWTPRHAGYLADWSSKLFGADDPFRCSRAGGKVYPDSGVGLFRNERYAVMGLAMPIAAEAGGHNHFDKASVLFAVGGIPVLVDSGTYCYTSDAAARRVHRAGRAHNVLLIDGAEQAHSPGRGAFGTPQFGRIELEDVGASERLPTWRMSHDGYARIPGVGEVVRTVRCEADGIVVCDRVEGKGEHRLELVFNIAPGLGVEIDTAKVRISNDRVCIATITIPPQWLAATESSVHSPAYMQKGAGTRIVLSKSQALPCEVSFAVTAYSRETAAERRPSEQPSLA